jgi:hypothetical protein
VKFSISWQDGLVYTERKKTVAGTSPNGAILPFPKGVASRKSRKRRVSELDPKERRVETK